MDRYQEIKEYVDNLILDIEQMKYYEHKVLCLFSLIDSFAQNYSNYNSKNNRECFCDFVLKFADNKKYSFLSEIDPVTLTYNINSKKLRFEELDDANIYNPNSSEIKNLLKSINLSKIDSKILEKHKYIKLLYCCRSKITHEQQSVGIIGFKLENDWETPIYFDFTEYWRLIFPYKFLKQLFYNCIQNYLEYQKLHGLDPFDNNIERKSFYAYYD